MILPGITRDSVLQLLRDHISGTRPMQGLDKGEKLTVSERGITMKEVKEASQSGKLVELFGAGTAAIISPVHKIGYLNEDIPIPTGPDGMGRIARAVRKELSDIQWGKISHPWSVPVDE
ncbi:hypothetical protein EYR40_004203 [Pleurotus pulmonarius]|nr:hypothetical protein EYR40_004203 [Pleurotus pulmonarius]